MVGGVLIIDAYGHWAGARRVVDEYLDSPKEKYLLVSIDSTARVLVKTS